MKGLAPPVLQHGRLPAAAAAAAAFAPAAALSATAGLKALPSAAAAAAVQQAGALVAHAKQQQQQQQQLAASLYPLQLQSRIHCSAITAAGNGWQCSTLAYVQHQQPAAAMLALQQPWPCGRAAACAAVGHFGSSAALQRQFQGALGDVSAQPAAVKVLSAAGPLPLHVPQYRRLPRLQADPLEALELEAAAP
uniref:Uncharacterized protein n=1 Tax=Tetradesmus obliquus TaxID=3088 RepID=A0A383W7C3_TETOB|eukprot:jgi/Sobl393_1/2630/SZX73062.1